MGAEARLAELGLTLPPTADLPPHIRIPFEWVRTLGDRACLGGHGALDAKGLPAPPFGKVPTEVSLDDAQSSALSTGLAMLGSLQRALGTLDRVQAWVTVNAFVNADAGYAQTTAVVNPLSDLLLEVFGDRADMQEPRSESPRCR